MDKILYAVAVAAQTSEPDAEHRLIVYVIWAKTPEAAQAEAALRTERTFAHSQERWYFEYQVSDPIAYQAITVAIPPPA